MPIEGAVEAAGAAAVGAAAAAPSTPSASSPIVGIEDQGRHVDKVELLWLNELFTLEVPEPDLGLISP